MATRDRELTFALSADYAQRTGGYVYDQRLVSGLAGLGWQVRHLALPAGFPNPSAQARAHAAAAFRDIADGAIVLVDQLCLGVLPEVAMREAQRLRIVMIVHHPLALEHDGSRRMSQRIADAEREALRHVAATIATSPATARMLMCDYDVPADRLIVAVPGVDRQPVAHGGSGRTPSLLSVGAVVPRKGHAALVAALSGLAHLSWRLVVVGNTDRAPAYVGAIRTRIAAAGLSGRVTLCGELSDGALARRWRQADLYVAASRHEGFGMAIAEALAHGLPVVTTHGGAVGEWIRRREAIVVPTGSHVQLTSALAQIITKPGLRKRLRTGALARRRTLPTWESTAVTVHRALVQIGAAG